MSPAILSAMTERTVTGSVCYPSIVEYELILNVWGKRSGGEQKPLIHNEEKTNGKSTKVRESANMTWDPEGTLCM